MITIEFPGMKITPRQLPFTQKAFRLCAYVWIEGFVYHWIYRQDEDRHEVYIFEDFEWRLLSDEEVDKLDEIDGSDLYPTRIVVE